LTVEPEAGEALLRKLSSVQPLAFGALFPVLAFAGLAAAGFFAAGFAATTVVGATGPATVSAAGDTGPATAVRYGHAVLYDPLRDRGMIFGGGGSGRIVDWYLDFAPSSVTGPTPGPPLALLGMTPNPTHAGVDVAFGRR